MTTLTDSMLTTSQAARELGVSSDWVRKLIRKGALPATDTPLGALISKIDLETYRKEREAKSVA